MFDGFKIVNQKLLEKIGFYLLFLAIFVLLTGIVFSPYIPYSIRWMEGDVAIETLSSPRYIEFQTEQDKLKTEELRTKRAELVEKIYSIDGEVNKKIISNIVNFFTEFKELQSNSAGKRRPLRPDRFSFLAHQQFLYLLKLDKNVFSSTEYSTIQNAEKILFDGLRELDTGKIKKLVNKNVRILDLNANIVSAITQILLHFLKVNMVYDEAKTQQVIEKEINAIKPIKTRLKKEEPIIYEGEVVTPYHIEILKALNMYRVHINFFKLFGILCLNFLLLILIERYIYYFNNEIHEKLKYYLIISLTILTLVSIARLLNISDQIGPVSLQFLIPISFSAILLSFMVSTRVSILCGTIISLLIGIMYLGDIYIFTYLLLSNFITIFFVHGRYKRSELIKSGYMVGFLNILFIISIGLLKEIGDVIWFFANSLAAFGNGLISVMISMAVLPYVEEIFSITTQQGLLEHANLNHPLMKRLMMEAPGTYQHSLMVANLAEAAAEAVQANVVLARTGAYFHDIGKMKRPAFYVENQFSGENPHHSLSARISKLIIATHTKDGVELANKYKLPSVVKSFMVEHHGTTLVSFFYSQALKTEEIKDSESTKDEFRYQGSKPQTKESGIVMLADSVEAAIRSMEKPTIPKMENLILKIVQDKIQDHQLVECPLSLREIHCIQETFVKIVQGIFHNRLDYQEELSHIIEQNNDKKDIPKAAPEES